MQYHSQEKLTWMPETATVASLLFPDSRASWRGSRTLSRSIDTSMFMIFSEDNVSEKLNNIWHKGQQDVIRTLYYWYIRMTLERSKWKGYLWLLHIVTWYSGTSCSFHILYKFGRIYFLWFSWLRLKCNSAIFITLLVRDIQFLKGRNKKIR